MNPTHTYIEQHNIHLYRGKNTHQVFVVVVEDKIIDDYYVDSVHDDIVEAKARQAELGYPARA